jgi:hypothetical protein
MLDDWVPWAALGVCIIAIVGSVIVIGFHVNNTNTVHTACEADGGIVFASRYHHICVKGDKILWRKER